VDLGIDLIYYSNWFLAIWRMWLKNWVSYALFNFELVKGLAAKIFEPHPIKIFVSRTGFHLFPKDWFSLFENGPLLLEYSHFG
jgi:hypothetical protein